MPVKVKIHNVPEYAWDYKFIVYSNCNGEFWFFGAYNEVSKALAAFTEAQGGIENTENVERTVENA